METKQMNRRRRRSSTICKLAVAVAVAVSFGEVSAWTTNSKTFRQQQQQQRKQLPGLLPPQGPSQKPNLTSQSMLKNPGNPRVRNTGVTSDTNNSRQLPKVSHSVLADCDTLPSFPTAHGLLSPETVMRLEELTRKGHGSEALVNFLDQYHRKGPLSCLTLLSDPEVLPHLTSALRDVTE